MLDSADYANFGCHNGIRLEAEHFLNTLALTFISFSGRFFCKRSSSCHLILQDFTFQPWEIAFNTMRYRRIEIVQGSGDFENRQCNLYIGAGEHNVYESKYVCEDKVSKQGNSVAR